MNINRKYQQRLKTHYLFDPIFQRVNRLFVLSFENNDDGTTHTTYFLTKVVIKVTTL